MVSIGKNIGEDHLKKVSGGAAANVSDGKVSGVENYPSEQSVCPKCNVANLIYKQFDTDDGKGTKIGQHCNHCGAEWTFGSKAGIK